MSEKQTFHFRTDYWADAGARAEFKHFMQRVFAMDLDPWDAAGCWDNDYRPFSLFAADGRIVASVCLYTMRLLIAGREARIGQISGMGVVPELRRRGLGRQLTEVALRWASDHGHESFLLFSSEEALPFYRCQGFAMAAEHTPVLRLAEETTHVNPSGHAAEIRMLDMANRADCALLFRLASSRCPISQRLGVLNERLLMFHALLPPRGSRLIYIPTLDVAVLLRRRDGILTLFDIVGSRLPSFAELCPFLVAAGDREVVFWFMIDRLGELAPFGVLEHRLLRGNNLHVRPGFSVSSPFILPFTAQA